MLVHCSHISYINYYLVIICLNCGYALFINQKVLFACHGIRMQFIRYQRMIALEHTNFQVKVTNDKLLIISYFTKLAIFKIHPWKIMTQE